jgi:hypothetical protein
MGNSKADDPGAPRAVPSSEAGRAGGRFEALRQRSSTVQDQVSRRREELERSRHLGLLLVAQRRFKQIEGGDLSVLISLSLFVAMVPLVLLGFSWLTGFSSSANLASFVIRHYSLHEPVASIVRTTFASASADRSSSSVLGVASWAVAGFPLAVSVQKTFARAWRVPMLGWMASYLRGGLWFLVYVGTQFGVEAAKWTLGHNLGLGVLAGLAGVALTFLLWLATPHLLLGKDLGGWRGLVPTAIAGTVVTVGCGCCRCWCCPGGLPPGRSRSGPSAPASRCSSWSSCWPPTGWWWRPSAPSTGNASPTRTPSSGQRSTVEPPWRRRRRA